MSCILAISLVFITIGEDDEKMFTDLAPLLKYTITNHESTEVKAAVSTPFYQLHYQQLLLLQHAWGRDRLISEQQDMHGAEIVHATLEHSIYSDYIIFKQKIT